MSRCVGRLRTARSAAIRFARRTLFKAWRIARVFLLLGVALGPNAPPPPPPPPQAIEALDEGGEVLDEE
jgi:hypothetical protein